ncbi:AAA family ATPase [uncultured Roseibium sp.]|uniref:AAA family ATPase n=1 Tax=uncultured Roseibium sp. TaxID=1936171 RepID=UPI00260C2E45|nr:AAA family ATPase [uncultured Roseibium sp.]
MSTAPTPSFSISARYLGPIFSLDGELTKHAQNLIFARNGTGKSFLSRAFRYLDLHGQREDVTKAAFYLVSDEAPDGKGRFSFSRGTETLGSLALEKTGDIVGATIADTLFHVFSEDFVQDELRERKYEIDGEIENEIAVDSDNIKLKDAQHALGDAQSKEHAAFSSINNKFEKEKLEELSEKAGINKRLKEYAELSFGKLLQRYRDKPDPPEQSFVDILKDLDSLKSIPAEPIYPEPVALVSPNNIDLGALESSLQKVTSPSSVSEGIKKKIDVHHGFYKEGAQIVQDEHRTECPFCEQGITAPDPKAIVDAYIEYFTDEEEKHKDELRDFLRKLERKEDELNETERHIARQKSHYDDLKRFVPSKKDISMGSCEVAFVQARTAISSIKTAIERKAGALMAALALPSEDLAESIAQVNKVIERNNDRASELSQAVEKADDERKALQRKACSVFEREFAIENWADIEALRTLSVEAHNREQELNELEKSSPSTKARDRVADTFELLLKEFFADKYLFDRTSFVLKRGDQEMARGPHRTLSDGEKTAIAFCYFVACVHRKVEAVSDYRKLFLVFDDPVTSMSYDFVFSIAQTLKNLNISDQGEVSTNPGKIDGNKNLRPNLLVLTHSSYFFNISRTNAVVKPEATFSLHNEGATHKLTHLRKYVAPFERQLEHVYQVANGNDPDHGTGNAIRSVLEAVGRFCRPDKSQSVQDFIAFLASEDGMSIKSVLINSLCHGTYYDEAPPPDDLKLACKETLVVVERYAVGHIELIKSAAGMKGK